MKKNVFFLAAALAAMCVACTNDSVEFVEQNDEMVDVTIGFGGFTFDEESMTRTASPVSDICTHLDIFLSDGTTTTAYNQATGDTGFGSLSLTLNVSKTYTLYAVAHKANGAATLSEGIISFPDDKVTHTFFISRQFTPTKGMSLNLTMQRIVAQFSFTTTDQVPEWCKTMRFTISNVYDRWNVSTGGTHQLDRVSTFQNFSTKADGTVTFNIYAIVTDAQTLHTVLVEGLDAQGDVQESHQFTNVPLRNNYKTVASGAFFTDASSTFSFLADDWGADIDYDF